VNWLMDGLTLNLTRRDHGRHPVEFRYALTPGVVYLCGNDRPVGVNGVGKTLQAGDESVIIRRHLPKVTFAARVVDGEALQNHKTNTAGSTRLIERDVDVGYLTARQSHMVSHCGHRYAIANGHASDHSFFE
jgi:hypothetical protein